MKLKKVIIFFLSLITVFSFTACKSDIEKYADNISELRDNVFEASNDVFKLTAITGLKETPYVLDGHASGSQDFTVITLEPAAYLAGKNYTYRVTIDGNEFTGTLVQHPFGKSYSADIKSRCKADSIQCVITDGTQNYELSLASVKTPDMITAEKALEIAGQKLKKQIQTLEAGGNLGAEIYIRLIANPIDTSGGYHWYVAYIGEAQTLYAVLIHPITMEIAAIRD